MPHNTLIDSFERALSAAGASHLHLSGDPEPGMEAVTATDTGDNVVCTLLLLIASLIINHLSQPLRLAMILKTKIIEVTRQPTLLA